MYYVITDNKVFSARSLKELEKKHKMTFAETDFISHGADFVVKLSQKDIEVALDARRLSLIPISNLFKKDNSNMIYFIVIILLNLIMLGKK